MALTKALAEEHLSMPILAHLVGYESFPEEAFSDRMRRILTAA